MKSHKETHQRYTHSFKIAAVKLAEHPNIQTQDVALALDIHPFMLSRWKKEYRDGLLKGQPEKVIKIMEEKVYEQKTIRELDKRLKRVERENMLLKKSMQFTSDRNKTSSSS